MYLDVFDFYSDVTVFILQSKDMKDLKNKLNLTLLPLLIILIALFILVHHLSWISVKKERLKYQAFKLSAPEENRNISAHKCLGHGYSSRSCVFRDIDYDLHHKKFKYYNPSESHVVAFEEHFALLDFPEKFVTLKSMVHRKTLYWTIAKTFEYLPIQKNPECVVHDDVLLWQAMQPINIGHVIMDDLFASFKVTENLGLSKNVRLRVILMEERCASKVCKRLQQLWFPSISSEPVVHFEDFVETYSRCSKIRFKQLYVGGAGSSSMLGNLRYEGKYDRKTDGYSIGNKFIAKSFAMFKEQVYRRNEVHSPPYKNQILFYNKTRLDPTGSRILTDRSIMNLHDVTETLKERFPRYEIKIVDPSTYQSFVEELQDLAKTRVLITPPGGVMFMALFLPKGSTLLGIDACLGPKIEDCGNAEIQRIFSFLNMNSFRYTPELRRSAFSSFSRMKELYRKNMRLDIYRLMCLLEQVLGHENIV
mmetsp:Transcript_2270/g.8078  ORF Transcript_2270/g.8078 Transcript_2270/m.8078 type:complete len:478 (+) Transcript_2270:623-2056(+)